MKDVHKTAARLIDMSLKPGRDPMALLIEFCREIEAVARAAREDWIREHVVEIAGRVTETAEVAARYTGRLPQVLRSIGATVAASDAVVITTEVAPGSGVRTTTARVCLIRGRDIPLPEEKAGEPAAADPRR